MLIISLATGATVITLNVHKRGDNGEPVPYVIQKIFFDFIARILCLKIKVNRKIDMNAFDAFPKYKQLYQKLNEKHKSLFNTNSNSKELLFDSVNLLSTVIDENKEFELKDMKKSTIKVKTVKTERFPNLSDNIILKASPCKCKNLSPSLTRGNEHSSEQKKLNKILRSICNCMEIAEIKEIIQEYKQEIKCQWTELAKIIDILMGLSFIVITLSMFIYNIISFNILS